MESNNIRCALLADQETAAGDGTAALGTQQGSDLRKPVIPGKAAGDGIAAHGTQQGSELGMSVIPGMQLGLRHATGLRQKIFSRYALTARGHANMFTWSGWQQVSLRFHETFVAFCFKIFSTELQ